MLGTLFFYLSKFIWALVAPASVLYLLFVGGCLLLWFGKTRLASRVLGPTLALFTLVAFLPLGNWLATPLEQRFEANPELPESVDGIIMLGGAVDAMTSYIWNQPEFGPAADRYFALADLARQYPDATLVFTGGSGSVRDQAFKEADIAEVVFATIGINGRNLVMERESRNTQENALNSKALVNPEPGESWVLITSAQHMPRSVGIFCQQGWPVIPYPVDHKTAPGRQFRIEFNPGENLESLNHVTREWLGLLAYYLTGKSDSLLPAGCH